MNFVELFLGKIKIKMFIIGKYFVLNFIIKYILGVKIVDEKEIRFNYKLSFLFIS